MKNINFGVFSGSFESLCGLVDQFSDFAYVSLQS